MTKVAELAKRQSKELSPLKTRVLQYLEDRSDEVFRYRDGQLARALNIKLSALNFTLWGLHRDGLIDKERANGKIHFGSHRAVADLRRRLGLTKHDPFERARAIRERIWARTGDVQVLDLLDGVRGSWE